MTTTINASNSGSGGLVQTADASGVLALQTAGTTAVTISAAQVVTFAGTAILPTTLGVGGATPSTSGSGITFPATASASTDANTLDDYEEGTFTPTIEGTTTAGTTTYSSRQGTYVKIGKYVYLQVFLVISAAHTGTGGTKITGFPFTSTNSFGAGGSVVYKTSFVTNGADFMQVEASTTFGYLRYSTGTSQADLNPSVNMQTNTGFMLSISYIASA
jgi:hypothetical protein